MNDRALREICPAFNASVDEFLSLAGPGHRKWVEGIRRQKRMDERPHPSSTLVDRSQVLIRTERHALIDAVADLVDENLYGRSEMCVQFADLLSRALQHLCIPARPVMGQAIYYVDRQEAHRWPHAWVRIGTEVIDANVDSLGENPTVPKRVQLAPYWGPIAQTPPDRRLREDRGRPVPHDHDVSDIWWPELKSWLDTKFAEAMKKPDQART